MDTLWECTESTKAVLIIQIVSSSSSLRGAAATALAPYLATQLWALVPLERGEKEGGLPYGSDTGPMASHTA